MHSEEIAVQEFVQFKTNQRELWAGFGANEGFTTIPAGELVTFAGVSPGERVLDVACGTGVVAITAGRAGAEASGLDLTPVLLERARENASIAEVSVDFTEGDAEALPYADKTFDVVLSQFGHMFAPRPEIAISEMLRVLRPGGRVAFTTWPPEHTMGLLFALMSRSLPSPMIDSPKPAPPPLWGDPSVIRHRLGSAVTHLRFGRGAMVVPVLSAKHMLIGIEAIFGPLKALFAKLDQEDPNRATALREEIVTLIRDQMEGNTLRQHFLMSVATKV